MRTETKVTDLMAEHDPPHAAGPPSRRDVDGGPATPAVSSARTAEEARRPTLALLDRLYAANAITLTERNKGRSAILGGELDEFLVPVLGAEQAHPAGGSIGDYLRADGALG